MNQVLSKPVPIDILRKVVDQVGYPIEVASPSFNRRKGDNGQIIRVCEIKKVEEYLN